MNATPESVERYLERLKKALHGADPKEQEEILSDIRSLISEHLETAERSQAAADAVLQRLGPPEALAEAYRMEGLLAQAAHSSAPLVILKATLRWAMEGVLGFITAMVVFIGYTLSLGFASIAVLKPIFPADTGLWVGPGVFFFGMGRPHPNGVSEVLGYWVIPVSILLALASFVLTTRLTRWFIQRRAQVFPLKSR
jgi:hypothetical protein